MTADSRSGKPNKLSQGGWRCFIGLPVPPTVRDELSQRIDQLLGTGRQRASPTTHWRKIPPANYHITLHFLGNCDPAQRALVREILTTLLWSQPLLLAIDQISPFPSVRKSRLIVALLRPNASLSELHRLTGDRLRDAGFRLEHRQYRPHISLARRHQGQSAQSSETITPLPLSLETGTIEEACLYRSHTEPAGSRYEVVARSNHW